MSKNGFTYSSRKIDVNKKITIVAAKWNVELVDELLESGKAHLEKLGFTNIKIVHVPGAWELVHAAQKYTPKDGVNFQQYAQLRVRGSIIDFLRKNSNLCRTTIKKKQEFEKSKFELQKKLGREPSKDELIDLLYFSHNL